MTRLWVLASVILSSATLAWGAAPPEPEVLSVCEALKAVERLNGKIIAIQGVVGWVGHHGVQAIVQPGLDPYTQSCPGIARQKRTWPPMLFITAPEYLEQHDVPAKFQARPPTLRDLADTLRQREKATGKDVAIATIIGEIRTREDIRVRHRGDDIIGNGYGQVGASPAMLIVQTVTSLIDPDTRKPLQISTRNLHLEK